MRVAAGETAPLGRITKLMRPHAPNSLARATAMFHPFDEYPSHWHFQTPDIADYTGLLLRGHLTVERELRALIIERCPNPTAFAKQPWTFSTLLVLARSFVAIPVGEVWVWDALARLNEARNALAHELPDASGEHRKVLTKLRGLVDFMSQQEGVKGGGWNSAVPFNIISSVFMELSWWLYRYRLDRIAALGIQSP